MTDYNKLSDQIKKIRSYASPQKKVIKPVKVYSKPAVKFDLPAKVNVIERHTETKIDSPEEIAQKLNTLEKAIKPEVIEGMLTMDDIVKGMKGKLEPRDIKGMPINMNDLRWHGSGVPKLVAGNNITLTPLVGGGYSISATGGGSPTDPSISLGSSPSGGTFEVGDSASNIDLTSTTTMGTNPIAQVQFFKNSSVIYTDNTPNPSGGTDTFTDVSTISTDNYL